MIRINNGKFEIEWEEGMTVDLLLERCKFTFDMIVVKVNGKVIPRDEYKTYEIKDGDEVGVIHLIAGG
jgi:thiamine biosynthesis protein ThiS